VSYNTDIITELKWKLSEKYVSILATVRINWYSNKSFTHKCYDLTDIMNESTAHITQGVLRVVSFKLSMAVSALLLDDSMTLLIQHKWSAGQIKLCLFSKYPFDLSTQLKKVEVFDKVSRIRTIK